MAKQNGAEQNGAEQDGNDGNSEIEQDSKADFYSALIVILALVAAATFWVWSA